MLLYNVTVKVEAEIEAEWLAWMQQTHIPEVLATGMFVKNQFLRLISQQEDEGQTYAVQYYCESSELLDEYMHSHAPIPREYAFAASKPTIRLQSQLLP